MNTIGIDEVGRGCWAGPLLVVAARASSQLPSGLTDSKLLSAKRRAEIKDLLLSCCEFGEGWVSATEIDDNGLAQAMRLGVERALAGLRVMPNDEIIMDGLVNYCPESYLHVKTVAKADRDHPIVSAASIYAKVRRDDYMKMQELQYPGYAFDKHVGYGTKTHSDAIEKLGICQLHRRSFNPVKAYL